MEQLVLISSGHRSAGGGCIKLIDVTRSVYIAFRTAGWKEGCDPCSQTGCPCPGKVTARDTLGHPEALNRRAQAASLGKRWASPAAAGLEEEQLEQQPSLQRPRSRRLWQYGGMVPPEIQCWKQGAGPEMGSSNPQGPA